MKSSIWQRLSILFVLALGWCLAGPINPVAAEKVLRICDGASDNGYSFDPYKVFNEDNIFQTLQIFDSLMSFDPEDNHIVPALATEWKRINPTTVQLKLRQGVKFHNGETFDAEAVKFSLERATDPKTKSAVAEAFKSLKQVDIVDSHTVNIVTKYPDGLIVNLLALFSTMLPPKYAKEAGAEGLAFKPVGTGPFKFKEWIEGEKTVLTANREYWKPGLPKVDTVEFYFSDTDKRTEKFMKGELDMITNVKPTSALEIAKDENSKVIKKDSLVTTFILINTMKEGPLKNKLVRQALNYAINVPDIIKYGAKGNGTPTATLAMKGEIGFNPDLKMVPYDPAKAKQLLTEAGYPNGLKLTAIVYPQLGGADGAFAKIVKSQLLAAGVEVEMSTSPGFKEVIMPVMQKQIPQVDLHVGTIPSVMGHIAFTCGTFFSSKGFASMVRDTEYDKLYDQITSTIDPAEQIKVCYKVDAYTKEQAYFINMFQAKRIYAVKKNIEFQPFYNGQLYMYGIEMK